MKKIIFGIGSVLIACMLIACGTKQIDNNVNDANSGEVRSDMEVPEDASGTNGENVTENTSEGTTENISENTSEDTTENVMENAGEDMSWQLNSETELYTDDTEDYYSVCTSYSKTDVESFASNIKQQILSQDWVSLSGNLAYPIIIDGTICNTADDFNALDMSNKISNTFTKDITDESCENMFCNYQGIMLGNGEIWINEVLNEDGTSQGLKVTAINISVQR